MKNFKLAALPLAVAGLVASNTAFAGTEACFEVYPAAADGAVLDWNVTYTKASCSSAPGVRDADLEALAPLGVAYELTNKATDGSNQYVVDYDNVDLALSPAAGTDQHIVYIPTTDIPPGTLLEFTLSGSSARFAGNNDIIHLVKYDEVANDGSFVAVASSDGNVDGESVITFLTKAGTTIGAGTRLALSKTSNGLTFAALEPIGIDLGNTACTTSESSSSVTLAVTQALTDGGQGYGIQGAQSSPEVITEISPQFYALQGGTTAEALVNAESTDLAGDPVVARTQFVYDSSTPDENLVVQKQQVIYKTAFYDRAAVLDRAHTIDAADHLETKFVTGTNPGAEIEVALYNAQDLTALAGAALSLQEEVEDTVLWGETGLTEDTATVYDTEGQLVFAPVDDITAEVNPAAATSPLFGAAYNEMFYVVTNERNADSGEEIMNFNYTVDTHYTLDFGDTSLLDHCAQDKTTHEIGVNGAVLKVPYVVSAEGNFVRITNEHNESAEVTFDMFGESDDGNANAGRVVTAVSLGTVPAKSSVVYFVPQLLEDAQAAGYLGADGGYDTAEFGSNFKSADNRHTVTFTVTAPRDAVHGVSVQKIIGGLDRVMPVLDQNAWSQ
ncbi:hypothetical protein [Thalassotalea ganghwensis]